MVLAKEKFGLRGRPAERRTAGRTRQPTFIPFSAATRMSGVNTDGIQVRKGAGGRDRRAGCAQQGGDVPARLTPAVEQIARAGGTPLVVAEHGAAGADAGARRRPPQGHREGRDAGAVRPAARDGHPHGDDHRRQPAHRRGDRRRSGRGRLPGRGEARGQAGADQAGAGRRPAGRDDRRRHQRRARRSRRPTSAWR